MDKKKEITLADLISGIKIQQERLHRMWGLIDNEYFSQFDPERENDSLYIVHYFNANAVSFEILGDYMVNCENLIKELKALLNDQEVQAGC